MEPHEAVGSVMIGNEDAKSELIELDIISDGLPDDPRFYLSFNVGVDSVMVAFPLKEVFNAIEKGIIS